jgi:hypothetical protein
MPKNIVEMYVSKYTVAIFIVLLKKKNRIFFRVVKLSRTCHIHICQYTKINS